MCSDPLIEALREFGYNPVRLPKPDIRPLDIAAKDGGELMRLGRLATLMVPESGAQMPKVSSEKQSPDISGKATGSLKIGLGLAVLGNFLQAMGASSAGLEGQMEHAKSLTFQFSNVMEQHVEIAQLDQFLAQSDVNPKSAHVGALLEADGVYVITSVLRSKKFLINVASSTGGSAKLDPSAIQQAVGGNVTVGGSSDKGNQLAFEGKESLVFGFQAIRLIYANGTYTAFKPASGAVMRALSLSKLKPELKNAEVYSSPALFEAL